MIADPVGESRVNAAALAVALEAIPSPAFLLGPSGTLKCVNRAGRHLIESEPRLLQSISVGVESAPGRFAVTRLPLGIGLDHYFVVLPTSMNDPESRIAIAAGAWRLTSRQTEVLRWILRGAANKEIAAKLARAEGTIELHVTALLSKARVETRAQLMAKFWLQL